jgi:hypothetical protein
MSKAGPELSSDGPRRPLRRAMRIASCMTSMASGYSERM